MNLPVQDPMNPSGFGRLPWGLISSPSVRMAHGAARPAWAMAGACVVFTRLTSYASASENLLILMSKHLVFTHSATEAEVLHSSLVLLGRVPWCLAGEVWLFDKLRGH